MTIRTEHYSDLSDKQKEVVTTILEKVEGLTFTEVKQILYTVRREVEAGMVVTN